MVGTVTAGVYNATQVIAYKPADLILFPMIKTVMVAFGRSSGDPVKLSDSYWRVLTAVVLLIAPLYAFIATNADGIIMLLLARQFAGGIPILEVLSLYLVCRTIGSTSGVALVPAGKHYWTFYPWVLALAVTISGVWMNATHPTTMGIVWSFTAGAVVVYSTIFMIAIYFIRPSERMTTRFLKALVITAGTSLIALAIHLSPLQMYARLFISLAFLPIIQLALSGYVFERDWRIYLSYSGVKKLWHAL